MGEFARRPLEPSKVLDQKRLFRNHVISMPIGTCQHRNSRTGGTGVNGSRIATFTTFTRPSRSITAFTLCGSGLRESGASE